jgi:predicted phosphoribosyltransferase
VSRLDEALCEELKELARRLGVQVREETLLREVGYRVRSGACRVHGADVIFVDRGLAPGERVQVLLDGIAGRDVETVYLSPALRRLIERRRAAAG